MTNSFWEKTSTQDSPKQAELFFETNPEIMERFRRCNFNVSVLGGNASKDAPQTEIMAKNLGRDLVKNWYSISTGGYVFGTMKAALEGGNEALSEMKTDPANQKMLGLFNPVIKGITAESLKPVELAVKGNNITNEVAEGKYDLYLRLGKLIEDSSACIILPGAMGTETEVMANIAFGKFKSAFGASTKPIIFIGDYFDNLVGRFAQDKNKMPNVFKVKDENEALELVNLLNEKQEIERNNADTAELQKYINSKLYL